MLIYAVDGISAFNVACICIIPHLWPFYAQYSFDISANVEAIDINFKT